MLSSCSDGMLALGMMQDQQDAGRMKDLAHIKGRLRAGELKDEGVRQLEILVEEVE